jgi:hypothetical protein
MVASRRSLRMGVGMRAVHRDSCDAGDLSTRTDRQQRQGQQQQMRQVCQVPWPKKQQHIDSRTALSPIAVSPACQHSGCRPQPAPEMRPRTAAPQLSSLAAPELLCVFQGAKVNCRTALCPRRHHRAGILLLCACAEGCFVETDSLVLC